MTGPEQHAATVQRLNESVYLALTTKVSAPMVATAIANLDELVALAGRADEQAQVAMDNYNWGATNLERAEAAEARADELQQRWLGMRDRYDREVLRGGELQRERDEQATAAMENYDWGVRLDGELQQARREADQLRAVVDAARVVSEIERTGVLPDFQPLADALAALAGVQAEERPPRDSGKPRSHP